MPAKRSEIKGPWSQRTSDKQLRSEVQVSCSGNLLSCNLTVGLQSGKGSHFLKVIYSSRRGGEAAYVHAINSYFNRDFDTPNVDYKGHDK